VKTKQAKIIFYLVVSLEAFCVCILGIASIMLYLVSAKSVFSLTFDNIMPYFVIFIIFSVIFPVAIFVLICIIYHIGETNKNETKYKITVKEENEQPPTYMVIIHGESD
jgi:hypothetical protein